MSEFSIKQYQNEVEKIIHFGGTKKETAIRNAFYNLLNEYASQKGLMLVTEIAIKTTNSNKMVTPDGTLKDILRQDWGYWESKDESDDLDELLIHLTNRIGRVHYYFLATTNKQSILIA